MTVTTKCLLSLLAVLCLHQQAAQGSFLAKKDAKGGLSPLDSPVIKKRLEELSGMKVDAQKLKNSFATDPLALMKTVLGSKAAFDYLRLDRSKLGELHKDTKVDGLNLLQTGGSSEASASAETDDETIEDEVIKANQPVDTRPFVEAKMELAAPLEIWNDIRKDRSGFNDMVTKTVAQEVAGPLKTAQVMGQLMEKGKLMNALNNPGEYNSWQVEDTNTVVEGSMSDISNPEESVGTDTVDNTVQNEDAKTITGSLAQVSEKPLRLRQSQSAAEHIESGQRMRVPDEKENEFVAAIEDDPEVEEMIKHDRMMDTEFPDDLTEMSDIKDWLQGKI